MELTWVTGVASFALLVASQSRRLKPYSRYLLTAGAVLFVLTAFVRANSTEEFIGFTILGIAAGSIYAIAAAGLVLTYTTTGVFNFAHGAVGMIAAFVFWQLTEKNGLNDLVAAAIVLGILGPAIALVLEFLFRRFRDADIGTTIVLTIAITVLCIGIAQFVFKTEAHNLPRILGDGSVDLFGTTVTHDQVLQIVLAVAIAVGLRFLLFQSRLGTGMRAVVDNATLASLNGASPVTIARASWLLGTELAVIAGILLGAGLNLEAIVLTFFVINAYGAAVFGKLKSLPLTFAGGIVLGIVQNWGGFLWPNEAHHIRLLDAQLWGRLNVSLPGLFLFLALLALPQSKLSVGRVVGRRAPAVPGHRAAIVRAAAFVAAMAVVVQVLPAARLTDATTGLVYGVLLLSLVLLTGFSGQVSLAQYVFVALGAWAMGKTFGGDSIFGMLAGGLIAVPFGALVALPALRLQGLYLALVTFGFAAISQLLIIQDPIFYGKGSVNVGRLDLLGLSFRGDKAFFVLCAIVFALLSVGVLALRRGSFGRRLAAMRDSQAACATLGLDIRRTKLAVFCLSAFVAGLAGSLFGGLKASVSDITIEPINNIVLFLFAVVGGITTVTGALLGGILFAVLPYVQAEYPDLAGLAFALVAAVAIGLGRQPNGLAGILYARAERFLGRTGPSAATTSTEEAAPGSGAVAPTGTGVVGATA